MPPRHHPHHRRRHPRHDVTVVTYETPIVYGESPDLSQAVDLDALVPPTDEPESKVPQAGDIFPTFVTPDDAKRYLNEGNASYANQDAAVLRSTTIPADYRNAWNIQMASWRDFYANAMSTVGWLNAPAVMGQTDRYLEQLTAWRNQFIALGGNPPTPPPTPPGQGVPPAVPPLHDLTNVILAAGAVAGIWIFGPSIVRLIEKRR